MSASSPPRVLVVEDDPVVVETLTVYLEHAGFEVVAAGNGHDGLRLAEQRPFALVVLDWMLPGIAGPDVLRRLRASSDVPVMMLTARTTEDDRVRGFDIGADDYVPKPFNPRELLARMRAVLRRAGKAPKTDKIAIGPIEIDAAARTVRRAGEDVPLTSYEFRILLALARRAGETVTREELATEVREPTKTKGQATAQYDPSVDRSLDVHVSRLRQKLEDDPKDPRLIKTVRGVGYVLARPPS